MKKFKEKAKAYALKNAIAHNGKASQRAVISSLFHEGLKKEEAEAYIKDISNIIRKVNSMDNKEQEKELENMKSFLSERKARKGLPKLPDAKKGKVIMRFAPSASGPLHIGHAATACISFLYVKKYGGKFYVRIEDTNPENIDKNSYKMIKEESDWLFDKSEQIMIQSDRMEIYYKYAEELIRKNAAYVCTCNPETFKKEYVEKKKDCPCRNLDVKEQIKRWKKMLSFDNERNFKQGEAVLRFKSINGMKSKNPAFRDFPLARINTKKHPRQKNNYRVWPLMNLAVSVDDIETKITHIIRAKDHRDNAKKQEMIFNVLRKKVPWTAFLGRFKFKDMELSTTKFRQAIERGEYNGWDDKRLPTLASLKKQGYKPEAFWKLAEQIGLSENDKVIDRREYFLLLDHFNNS